MTTPHALLIGRTIGAVVHQHRNDVHEAGGIIRRFDVYGTVLATAFPFATPGPETNARAAVRFTCAEVPTPYALDPGCLVDAQGRRDDGEADFAFYRLPGFDAVRITGATDFLVADDHIECRLVDPAHRYLVEIALMGMVFALWLERRGLPTLHASAATVDGRAVGFLGSRGGGKTSLAAGCLNAGHALLADDLLAIRWTDGTAYGQRGWPALRLWPDQLRHFVGAVPDLPVVHPDHHKRRMHIGDGFGRFAHSATPLVRLYLPERTVADGGRVSIQRLDGRHAVMALLRHSFLPREVERFGLQPERLRQFARLVAGVPVAVLRYPSGFDRLTDVVAAIEADLAEQ